MGTNSISNNSPQQPYPTEEQTAGTSNKDQANAATISAAEEAAQSSQSSPAAQQTIQQNGMTFPSKSGDRAAARDQSYGLGNHLNNFNYGQETSGQNQSATRDFDYSIEQSAGDQLAGSGGEPANKKLGKNFYG